MTIDVAEVIVVLKMLANEYTKGIASEAGKATWQRVKTLFSWTSDPTSSELHEKVTVALEAKPDKTQELLRLIHEAKLDQVKRRRRHIWGKTKDGRKAIWIAELQGDDAYGTHRTLLIDALCSFLQENVDILRAGTELKTDESGDAAADSARSHTKARYILQKRKGDLVIWGQLIKVQTTLVLRLHFSSLILDRVPTLPINCEELLPNTTIAGALSAVAAALAISPEGFTEKLDASPPAEQTLQGSSCGPQPPDFFAWVAGEAGKVVINAAVGVQYFSAGLIGNLGTALIQGLQASGYIVGQIGQASVTALNQIAVTGWSLLCASVPAADALSFTEEEAKHRSSI